MGLERLVFLAGELLLFVYMQDDAYVAVVGLFVGVHGGHFVLPLECEWIEAFIVFLLGVGKYEPIFEPEVIG